MGGLGDGKVNVGREKRGGGEKKQLGDNKNGSLGPKREIWDPKWGFGGEKEFGDKNRDLGTKSRGAGAHLPSARRGCGRAAGPPVGELGMSPNPPIPPQNPQFHPKSPRQRGHLIELGHHHPPARAVGAFQRHHLRDTRTGEKGGNWGKGAGREGGPPKAAPGPGTGNIPAAPRGPAGPGLPPSAPGPPPAARIWR